MAVIVKGVTSSGGGAKIATILNDDGTQSLVISDKDTVIDLTPLDSEINEQADLIAQIQAELDAKAEGGGSLPEGYTQREYIESTGTQYIDTEFKPNQNTRVLMDFTYYGGDAVFCAYDSTGTNSFGLQYTASGWYGYYGAAGGNSGIGASGGTRYLVDFNKNVLTINGATKTFGTTSFSCHTDLWLGALLSSGAADFHSFIRIYSCQIYDNGTLVRDFVPCINGNGEAGLYDIVNGKFYGNAGTGEFNPSASPVLLWTNASPTSAFAAQTVNFDGELGGYIIEALLSPQTSNSANTVYAKIYIPANTTSNLSLANENSRGTSAGHRMVTTTQNSIEFEGGYFGSTARDTWIIPQNIWGVKFTL